MTFPTRMLRVGMPKPSLLTPGRPEVMARCRRGRKVEVRAAALWTRGRSKTGKDTARAALVAKWVTGGEIRSAPMCRRALMHGGNQMRPMWHQWYPELMRGCRHTDRRHHPRRLHLHRLSRQKRRPRERAQRLEWCLYTWWVCSLRHPKGFRSGKELSCRQSSGQGSA